jgi:hypothetical protein
VVGRLKPRTFKARGLNRSRVSAYLNADDKAATVLLLVRVVGW